MASCKSSPPNSNLTFLRQATIAVHGPHQSA